MSKDEQIRLRHMLDAANKAMALIQGRSRADLDNDETMALALVRLIEILGEAANNVPQHLKDENPQIAWRQMVATRNRLIHGYFDIDLDVIWSIVTRDVPPLVTALKQLLVSEGN